MRWTQPCAKTSTRQQPRAEDDVVDEHQPDGQADDGDDDRERDQGALQAHAAGSSFCWQALGEDLGEVTCAPA